MLTCCAERYQPLDRVMEFIPDGAARLRASSVALYRRSGERNAQSRAATWSRARAIMGLQLWAAYGEALHEACDCPCGEAAQGVHDGHGDQHS